ncbi:molybdopterin molybdotransferase MoeA [Natrinema halophilum]|uniref:molybdopterin molybdotransferase MoeA n=1 Tax=Natrinema halophilum TaxID=1699371 RepID=UPI001F3CB933|nr:molybdopterin molybdotransferase MoeA [Natrinema halophilum]UHQ96152.1 molybdopterin molybdotransferase MoeA [Natrinema halophilum]
MGGDHEDLVWRRNILEQVLTVRQEVASTVGTETVPIDSISGRTIAEPVVADRDMPEHDFATMDGFAFDATDPYPLTVVEGEVYPENKPSALESGEAIRVATGAPIPEAANAVLKREDATVEDGLLHGTDISPGTYTYERGGNVSEGDVLFERGDRLSAKDAILLGDLGKSRVDVTETVSTGVLATGTEIHEGRSRDLDSPMLSGLVRSWGHEATYEGTVPDEYDRIESSIEELATEYDVVITTGGTSVGHKDHVIRALESLGSVVFHRVRLRPGKPIALARLPDHDAIVFAIPGKPIGAHTVATLVMRPFFTGETSIPTVPASMERAVSLGPDGFEYAIPVTLSTNAGDRRAMPLGHSDSPLQVYDDRFDPSVLSSSTRASQADGIVITRTALEADENVEVVPYSAIE